MSEVKKSDQVIVVRRKSGALAYMDPIRKKWIKRSEGERRVAAGGTIERRGFDEAPGSGPAVIVDPFGLASQGGFAVVETPEENQQVA